MTRIFSTFLVAFALVFSGLSPAVAGTPPPGTPRDAYGQAPRANIAYARSKQVPVCNNALMPTSSLVTTGQGQARTVLYCPNGVKSLVLLFPGAYVATDVETDLTEAAPMLLSAAVTPAPWSGTATYQIGDRVSWYPTFAGSANNPIFTATASNTNSEPRVGSSNWSAGTASPATRLTCSGQTACGLQTVANAAGTTTAQGWFETDPWAPGAGCASACYIEVRAWVSQSGTARIPLHSLAQPFAFGSTINSGATITDLTMTGGWGSTIGAAGGSFRPLAAIGVPVVDKPTVCFVGDSISVGMSGFSVASQQSVSAGGSGYVAGDQGAVLTMANTGAGAGAVVRPARYVIMLVTTGAVASVRMLERGEYANAAHGYTLPSGTQATTGGTGTGAILTAPTFSATGYDVGDATGAQGYIQRGLTAAGLAWVGFGSSGDTLAGWNTRDYTRRALMARVNCDYGLIELGINDVTNSVSTANIAAYTDRLGYAMLAAGMRKVGTATITPQATSTDGHATLGSQTTPGSDTARITENTRRRTVPGPFSFVCDTAATLESSLNSGKWAVDGTVGFSTIDGKHPTTSGHVRAAAALTSCMATIH